MIGGDGPNSDDKNDIVNGLITQVPVPPAPVVSPAPGVKPEPQPQSNHPSGIRVEEEWRGTSTRVWDGPRGMPRGWLAGWSGPGNITPEAWGDAPDLDPGRATSQLTGARQDGNVDPVASGNASKQMDPNPPSPRVY